MISAQHGSPPAGEPWTLTARWVFPADRPPLRDGFITIHEDTIVAVEPAGGRKADVDLGNSAILPGLVNAHTHLDLSDARGKCPPTKDFTAWLKQVISHRRRQTSKQVRKAIKDGIRKSTICGVTLIGDISADGASYRLLRGSSMRAVVYFEVLGLARKRIVESIEAAQRWLGNCSRAIQSELFEHVNDWSFVEAVLTSKPDHVGREYDFLAADRPSMVIPGVSPHAPFSVNTWGFWLTSRWNRQARIPIAVHLAETNDEIELLASRTGPFVSFLQEIGAWTADAFVPSIDWIVHLFEHGPTVLWIHGNYLPPDLPYPSQTIVYCPRTHAAFGHPPHPFREFLKRGMRVVLGTDSLASNPDLDILAEARFVAARHPDLPGETLLRMITLDSAIALGWGDVAGSLTPGKSADLVVLPLPDREDKECHRMIFDSQLPVQRVMFRGQWLN